MEPGNDSFGRVELVEIATNQMEIRDFHLGGLMVQSELYKFIYG